MDAFIGLITIVGLFWLGSWLLGVVGNVVSGKPAGGFKCLEVRIVPDEIVVESGNRLSVYAVQMRGPFPITLGVQRLMVSVSILDKDPHGNEAAVFSLVPDLSEGPTNAFLQEADIGTVTQGSGLVKWVSVLNIPSLLLHPAYGGARELVAEIRLLDANDPPLVANGRAVFSKNDTISTKAKRQPFVKRISFSHEFKGKGWLEKIHAGDESRKLAIGLAVAVAMADGNIDDDEGIAIQSWIKKYLAGVKGPDQERLRSEFNSAFEAYYKDAEDGNLDAQKVAEAIVEVEDKASRYEAIELCYVVMAADGKIEKEELDQIKAIAQTLELEQSEIQRIHDGVVTLGGNHDTSTASDEDLLGLDPSWDEGAKLKHLRSEFKKWNARLNSLEAGEERERAQHMIDKIGELRAKLRG